ncbi:MAG: dienelactone hydrolase family protein [Candidatus Dormibacteria bacterium]
MIVQETVAVTSHYGSLPVEVFRDDSSTTLPAVIVIHDIFGMSQDVRTQAIWLAENGFLAVVPDFFAWNKRIVCIQSAMRDIQKNSGRLFDAVESVRMMLQRRSDCSGRIGVIGFCFGGSFALLLAPREGYHAVNANYGMLPKDYESFFTGSCPILALYGKRDRTLRGTAAKLDAALEKSHVSHTVIEYPSAGHGFLNDHDPSEHPLIFAVIGRLLPAGYDKDATEDARPRIINFLHDTLDPTPSNG